MTPANWLRRATAALALAAAACSASDGEPKGAPLPAKAATVTVSMADYAFVYAKRVPAGRVVFAVRNAGSVPHRLSVFALADGDPPIEAQLAGTGPLPPSLLQNMPVLAPGESSSFAVDLMPGGRYALASLQRGPRGVLDAELGMTSEFRAAARRNTP